MDEILNLFVLMLSMLAPMIYNFFHGVTEYRYYNMRKIERNIHLERIGYFMIAFCYLIAIIIILFRIPESTGFIQFLIIPFGSNLFVVVLISLKFDEIKSLLIINKCNNQIWKYIEKTIQKETWWEQARRLFDLYSTGQLSFFSDEFLPIIVVQKLNVQNLKFTLPEGAYIRNHPYYSGFIIQVDSMKLDEVLERMGIDIYKKNE